MKRIRKTAMMLFTTMAVIIAGGCTKSDDPNNGGNGGNTYNGHAYVDLGLPSGTLWATCNVGATTPEGYGSYFAWGETSPKETYNWTTYLWCVGDGDGYNQWGDNWFCHDLTKYCSDPDYGYNGFCDHLSVLLPNDDAATANWGDGWCTPTLGEWEELWDYTIWVRSFQNNVNGLTFTSLNGNSIFLPCTACVEDGNLNDVVEGNLGKYWTSTCNGYCDSAKNCIIQTGPELGENSSPRCWGCSVRPVRSGN